MSIEEEFIQASKEAVQQNGCCLIYVKNPTENIYFEAIKKGDNILQFIENQTPEMCLASVQKNGINIAYVKHQTEEIRFEAFKQNKLAKRWFKYNL